MPPLLSFLRLLSAMKELVYKWSLLIGMIVVSQGLFAQEICDNGVDDDSDGLIDLNDPDCQCAGITGSSASVQDLIPNSSFEDTDCCPSSFSQLNCAQNWVQASNATSDYFNTCDYDYLASIKAT